MKIKLSQIVEQLGGRLVGADMEVTGIAPTNLVNQGQITFLTNDKYKKDLLNSNASAIILSEINSEGITIPHIITDNPYWYFSKVSQIFNPRRKLSLGIRPTAVIDMSKVSIGVECAIDNYVIIGENVTIGDRCQIHPHVVIGNNVKIGNNITIFPNVTIYDNVTIGDDCILHSGVVIGADGFGNAVDKNKHFSRVPQIGGVLIGNNVEVGANTTIDSGTFTPTIVEDGVVIDNLDQIAHNVEIGAHTGIAACVGIAGSTKIGKYCNLGGGACITGHISIADHTVIGGATGVSKSVTKPDLYFSSYPFSTLKDWAKNAVHIKNLHNMHLKLKELEKKLEEINGRN